jgi:putative CocE/NonD family hydrolase
MRYCRRPLTIALLLLIGASRMPGQAPGPEEPRESKFGRYSGYSKPLFDEWVRTSRYLEMSDGIKLAVDVIRPARDGKPAEERLPAVWNYYAYVRARVAEGKVVSIVDASQSLLTLVKHGYVIVVVDARGLGASYGPTAFPGIHEEGRYGYEITEWIACQPWCDGHVGMQGHSYSALMNFMIASYAPPHLRAIFPSMAPFDIYQLPYPGGVYRKAISDMMTPMMKKQAAEAPVARVDEDVTGAMLAEAKRQHKETVDVVYHKLVPFRDSEKEDLKPWTLNNLVTHLREINESRIPVYQWSGWFDVYVRDAFQWHANLEAPRKIAIGPWAHSEGDPTKRKEWGQLVAVEQLRWFDYWLKGIDNGIMDEPPIHFAVMEETDRWTWREAGAWPLPGTEVRAFYAREGRTGSAGSSNDGFLSAEPPPGDRGEDAYSVDPSATAGEIKGPRTPNRGLEDPDMSPNDAKGLTYTSPLLAESLEVSGHPLVTIFIRTNAADADFYAYLEEVDGDGKSHYITDGVLRASHRTEAAPPFDNLGLPWHRHYREDVTSIPAGEIIRLRFDLMPTSNVFDKGHRLRLTITCANAGIDEPVDSRPKTVTLMRNAAFPSRIELPVMK